jgi:hypothetical protein
MLIGSDLIKYAFKSTVLLINLIKRLWLIIYLCFF